MKFALFVKAGGLWIGADDNISYPKHGIVQAVGVGDGKADKQRADVPSGKTFVYGKLGNFKSGLALDRTVIAFDKSGGAERDKTGKVFFAVQLGDENMSRS